MNWFLQAGLNDKTPPTEYHRIYFLNRLIIVCVAINLSIFVVDMILGVFVNGFSNLALILIYLPLFILHHKGRYKLVRAIFSVLMTVFVVVMSIATFYQGRWTETENIMYAVFIGNFFLFNGFTRKVVCAAVAAILIGLKYYKYEVFDVSFNSDFTLTLINVVIVLVAAYFFMNGFQQEFERMLKRLVSLNQTLEHQKNELSNREQRLNDLNTSRNKLFSIVAHDLKNPLSQLKQLTHLTEKGLIDSNQHQKVNLMIEERLSSIEKMMDNVIHWAKSQLNGQKVHKDKIRIDTMIPGLLSQLDKLLNEKQLSVEFEAKSEVWTLADEEMVSVVFRNVFTNAVKYSNVKSKVVVTVGKEANNLFISIKDEGIGIKQDRLEALKRGSFVDSADGTLGEKGTGLGIMLSQELLTRFNGELKFDSENGLGTKVTIQLPLVTKRKYSSTII